MNRTDLEAVTKNDIRLLTNAIALAARRGLPTGGLPDMITRLTLWLKSGRNDFNEWDALCQQKSAEWEAWYERYTKHE